MPSPFPGMDPYLEDPVLWPDVHHGLISEIQATLNSSIRPKYVARVEVRVYSMDEEDPAHKLLRIPDVQIDPAFGVHTFGHPRQTTGGLETDGGIGPLKLKTMLVDDDIEEAFLKVIEVKTKNVVTHIEIVSPTNKVSGSRGRKCYIEKRDEVLNSSSHFVEVDLLRRPADV